VLVQEVAAWLADHGYTDMQEVSHTEERLTFALPQELRRDLRTARR
jgi:4-hydroxy-3-methylbut-2-enyl diphosphate reductase